MGSAQHLLNIINDILDFSKIEAGKLSMETIRFELEKVMDHLAGVLSFKAEEKELELLFRLDENIPQVLSGDPFRLEQILTNLINNAIKFTDKGSILLSVKRKAIDPDKGRICLEFKVKDTGIGLTRSRWTDFLSPSPRQMNPLPGSMAEPAWGLPYANSWSR